VEDQSTDVRAASERAVQHLRDAILRGDLPPGARIRQEGVAERLGASRLPVREALRMLEMEGLTQSGHIRRTRIQLGEHAEIFDSQT
jgi:DNA-binding GntR family transcriptional regulator